MGDVLIKQLLPCSLPLGNLLRLTHFQCVLASCQSVAVQLVMWPEGFGYCSKVGGQWRVVPLASNAHSPGNMLEKCHPQVLCAACQRLEMTACARRRRELK